MPCVGEGSTALEAQELAVYEAGAGEDQGEGGGGGGGVFV